MHKQQKGSIMYKNQQGAIHFTTALLAIVVLSIVSFAAYRIGASNDASNQSRTESQDVSLADGIKVNEASENEAKEVTIPKKETTADSAPVVEPPEEQSNSTHTEKPKEEVKQEIKKEDKVWLQMQKISAAQKGSVVNVSSRLPSAQTGTCHFKLWQDGYERVYSNAQISNSTDCVGQINVANMVTYDGWELHVWFDGSDGKTHGYQTDEPFPLTDPN